MAIVFRIDASEIENNAAVIDWYRRFAAECLKEAQRLTAEKIEGGTGAYARGFDFQLLPGSPPKLLFGNKVSHAIYVEEDTEPHKIEPTPTGRKAFSGSGKPGALRWFQGPGSPVFAREVQHPGTKGMHIVRDAVTSAAGSLGPNQGRLL